MLWEVSHRADKRSRLLADRHYNRQKVGTRQFVPPGRCCVFYAQTKTGEAIWVTSWPYGQFVKHAWPGAWICSIFRNEKATIASLLITQALAATRHHFGDPPSEGLVTFIDKNKVEPIMVRGVKTWGRSFVKAGFHIAGETKGGLLALHIDAADIPVAAPARPAMLAPWFKDLI